MPYRLDNPWILFITVKMVSYTSYFVTINSEKYRLSVMFNYLHKL